MWHFTAHDEDGDSDFARRALLHFLAHHATDVAQPPPVFELARHDRVRRAEPAAIETGDQRSLTLHRAHDGWRVTVGVDTWFRTSLTRGALRQFARATDGPLYVTELTMPGRDLLELLATKARLEALLARLRDST